MCGLASGSLTLGERRPELIGPSHTVTEENSTHSGGDEGKGQKEVPKISRSFQIYHKLPGQTTDIEATVLNPKLRGRQRCGEKAPQFPGSGTLSGGHRDSSLVSGQRVSTGSGSMNNGAGPTQQAPR